MMKGLNLGCGERFHPDWTNLDSVSTDPGVQVHNLVERIPFPDSSFDVLYLSHLLEHFSKQAALKLLEDCCRVLCQRGTIRVVVPDLEQIARLYLQALERALQGCTQWQQRYEWMMLELYDQTVRERSGGAVLEYLKQNPIPDGAFVYQRIGAELRRARQELATSGKGEDSSRSPSSSLRLWLRQLPQASRLKLQRVLLGKMDYRALEVGRFRMGGEVHQWMYDRYSLARALERAGFVGPHAVGPTESRISNWTEFHLDTEPDGTVYKPDSLYMEAVKP